MVRQSTYSLADYTLEGKGKSDFLFCLSESLDWQAIEKVLAENYRIGKAKEGRPAHPPLQLFKMLLLGLWHSLSDQATEQACSDRISFMRFLSLGLSDPTPDATRLVRFRSELSGAGLEACLAEVNRQLDSKGLLVKQGVMVDATITEASRKPERLGGKGDAEADYARRGKRSRLGYKAHTATDEQGMVLAVVTTVGSKHDGKQLPMVLDKAKEMGAGLPENSDVIADKGYTSKANDRAAEQRGLRPQIMHKANRNRPLTDEQRDENKRLGQRRYVVERTFGSAKRWFRAFKTRYLGLAKTHIFHLLWAVGYNLKRLPGLIEKASSPPLAAPAVG